jgi:hypothetical protein
MRTANNEFKFRSPSKLLDFRDANVANIAGVIDKDLQAVHELEEMMTTYNNDAECGTEEIVSLAP